MEIKRIIARRTVQLPIGQYAYDQRVFEIEAELAKGEDVRVATLALNEVLANCLKGEPAEEPAPAPVTEETVPEPVAQEAEEAKPEPVAEPKPEVPAEKSAMSDIEFAQTVVGLSREKGIPQVMKLREKYGVTSVSQIKAEQREAFLAELRAL